MLGRTYRSGYLDRAYNSRGVAGYGFPFLFWPVVWGADVAAEYYAGEIEGTIFPIQR